MMRTYKIVLILKMSILSSLDPRLLSQLAQVELTRFSRISHKEKLILRHFAKRRLCKIMSWGQLVFWMAYCHQIQLKSILLQAVTQIQLIRILIISKLKQIMLKYLPFKIKWKKDWNKQQILMLRLNHILEEASHWLQLRPLQRKWLLIWEDSIWQRKSRISPYPPVMRMKLIHQHLIKPYQICNSINPNSLIIPIKLIALSRPETTQFQSKVLSLDIRMEVCFYLPSQCPSSFKLPKLNQILGGGD